MCECMCVSVCVYVCARVLCEYVCVRVCMFVTLGQDFFAKLGKMEKYKLIESNFGPTS